MHVSAWKKDKKTMIILLDLLHQVNIKYDLNFSFLAIAAGRRGKEQTKEIQTISAMFCSHHFLKPLSFICHFFSGLVALHREHAFLPTAFAEQYHIE